MFQHEGGQNRWNIVNRSLGKMGVCYREILMREAGAKEGRLPAQGVRE